MLGKVYTATLMGIEGELVTVQVDINKGMPAYNVIGLASSTIKEGIERIKPAINNSCMNFPRKKVTINLAPANKRKDGSHFDLPIAAGILAAQLECGEEILEEYGVIGELSLDGKVNRVKGAMALAISLMEAGKRKIVIPKENLTEVAMLDGIVLYPVETLKQVYDFLNENIAIETAGPKDERKEQGREVGEDFSDVIGQENGKRAIEIACAGGHDLLMVGSPGVGKTMLAKRVSTILPQMTQKEALEVTKVYSVAGLLDQKTPIITERPFRNPHHSITQASLIGGGFMPMPGEISLAHRGVLFLDELAQFESKILDTLRQPLESKKVIINRQGGKGEFPCESLLIAASNPCKCGFFGHGERRCTCTDSQIASYRSKISGPLLDRIDIYVEMQPIDLKSINASYNQKPEDKERQAYTSKNMKERVIGAREIQRERFKEETFSLNGQMGNKEIKTFGKLTKEAKCLIDMSYEKMSFSMRAYNKIKKVARTIADLEGETFVGEKHISEALQYRERNSK